MVVKMAKEGVPASKIGLALRDLKGVPSIRAVTGKRMCELLKDEGASPEYPEDLIALIKKAVKIRTHLKDSTADTHNAVKLSHIESKINRLVKYYAAQAEFRRTGDTLRKKRLCWLNNTSKCR